MAPVYENIIESCKSLLELTVAENDIEKRRLKYIDFKDKFDRLYKNKKKTYDDKEHYDVLIFTIVPVEFNILTQLLGILKTDWQPDFNIHGRDWHQFEIRRANNLRSLKAAVCLIGTAGDISCSLACATTFERKNCDLAILCGIAAGVEIEVKKYSTVVSQAVVNYEFQKIEEDGVTFRPKHFVIDQYNYVAFSNLLIDKHLKTWKKNVRENVNKIITTEDKQFENSLLENIDVKLGVIASGAKLIADGKTILELRNEIPVEKGIIAVEMEGGGFCPACQEYERKWMVFRGVSDYGDKDKNEPINKEFQKIAVASAVTTMMLYLQQVYKTPAERGEMELPF